MTAADRARIESSRKSRSGPPAKPADLRRPDLTAARATEFVKLLHAGIPREQILVYFAPAYYHSLKPSERLSWLAEWGNDPLMAKASSDFLQGAWHDLDKDARLSIALDKHMAELAYFLYTTDYEKADGLSFKKTVDARTALMTFVAEGEGDSDTPFMKAMKDILAGKVDDLDSPPKMGVAIPTERVRKPPVES